MPAPQASRAQGAPTAAMGTSTANAPHASAWNSRRVRCSPSRTARVCLPVTWSVGMSRRLFTTRIAVVIMPTGTATSTAYQDQVSSWTYCEPTVATSPKKTKTKTSPRAREA